LVEEVLVPRIADELGALQVAKRARTVGLHFVGGVHGLALQVTSAGAKSWLLRMPIGGKRREMGLGPYPEVTLARAREKAREARELVRAGVDPIQRQREAASALRAAAATALTFDDCAASYIKAHEASWRNVKHGQQWRNTLKAYVSPAFGGLLVRDVGLTHVLQVLEPIWTEKNETASRLRSRIELVLDWASARGLRSGPNPARWRGHLDKLLPKPSKVKSPEHHAAVPVGQAGAFMERLRQMDGMGARALEFAVLTAARSGEVRGAKWSEIDERAKVWIVPADRMKAGKEHRVPLSDAASALLKTLPRVGGSDLLFPGPKGNTLSDMALTAVMRRMQVPAVPHGFRSTFRDWAAERTNYPREVAEMALAHAIGDKVEAAYRRGDLFEKRRHLMADWAAFLSQPERCAEVVNLSQRQA
jgi:integrase